MSGIEQEVRKRLRKLRLHAAEREEVFAEITAHLECVAEELRAKGVGADEALRRSLSQLDDVRILMRELQRAKESVMRDSFRRVWLPAAVVVLLVYVSQMIVYRLIPQPRAYHIMGSYYAYSWGWLFTVAVCGAFGAWWSREVGGSVKDRLLVALAPAEAMAVVVALVLPLDLIVQVFVEHRKPFLLTHPIMILAAILWLLQSAVPSFIGAALFLRGGSAQAREIAS